LLGFRPQWLKPEMVQWLQIFVTFVSSWSSLPSSFRVHSLYAHLCSVHSPFIHLPCKMYSMTHSLPMVCFWSPSFICVYKPLALFEIHSFCDRSCFVTLNLESCHRDQHSVQALHYCRISLMYFLCSLANVVTHAYLTFILDSRCPSRSFISANTSFSCACCWLNFFVLRAV
jgi:hypothetical protein